MRDFLVGIGIFTSWIAVPFFIPETVLIILFGVTFLMLLVMATLKDYKF